MLLLRFLLLLILSNSIQAEVFQWTDDNGQKHYSDKSKQDAKVLNINPGYSFYQVKKVFDGDTVLLGNGNKVRLLGINTPEVEGRYKSAQALGEEAKQWLQENLKNKKIRLEKDVEKRDKYNRLLAHVFTEDKQHINLELVKKGFASVNIYPPNLKYIDKLLAAETIAEKKQLGLWSHADYKVKQVSDILQQNYKGWQRIVGRVESIRYGRKNIYLKLSEAFSLKIASKSKKLFPDLDDYLEKHVEVRGWIKKHKSRFIMFIRHSSAIIVLKGEL